LAEIQKLLPNKEKKKAIFEENAVFAVYLTMLQT
jgi:hypothetical protein